MHTYARITTVLLNRTKTTQPHLLQYSLAPLEETEQLAQHVTRGYSHPLVLFDGTASAQATADLFTSKISALGGIVVDRAQLSGDLTSALLMQWAQPKAQVDISLLIRSAQPPYPQTIKNDKILIASLASDLQSDDKSSPCLNTAAIFPSFQPQHFTNLTIP